MSLFDSLARPVFHSTLGLAFATLICGVPAANAQQNQPIALNSAEQTNAAIDRSVADGIAFLKNRGQAENGAFSPESGVAVTALCVKAILKNRPQEVKTPEVREAIDFILQHVQSDGGIYARGSTHRNYETSVAVGALVAAQQDDEYESELKRAEAFLKGLQWDEEEGVKPSDPAYGGAGYGSHSRPDLSNTSFMLEALRELGNDSDDEAVQKALRFVTRTQNLAGEGNDTPHADKINDGGFYYTPAAGGETKVVSDDDGGGLRSYGSMTYAGLKSMIYAGLTEDDPRVRAAMEFIEKTYSLTENPGIGHAGLYYYYHTFAKALDAADVEAVTDAEGDVHDWNRELAKTLITAQQSDGSWVNDQNTRWMEGNRNLVTAYALLALNYCRE